MSDFRKNILRKKIIVMKYQEKNCLNSKKNLLWRIILGKKSYSCVCQGKKLYHQRFGEKVTWSAPKNVPFGLLRSLRSQGVHVSYSLHDRSVLKDVAGIYRTGEERPIERCKARPGAN